MFATVGHVKMHWTDALSEVLRYLPKTTANALHRLLEKSRLYSLKSKYLKVWTEVTKYNVEDGTLLLAFGKGQICISDMVGVRRPRDPTTQVVQLEEEGNALVKTAEPSLIFPTV